MTFARLHIAVPGRRGFSLVEVLVAILVLALGLLGLGAVFPVVLREQRIATETTLGTATQNSSTEALFAINTARSAVNARINSIVDVTTDPNQPRVRVRTAESLLGLTGGNVVQISGSDSTPGIDGNWLVISATDQSFLIETNVNQPGTTGEVDFVLDVSPVFGRSGGAGWRAMREVVIQHNQSQGQLGDWVIIEPEQDDFDRLGHYTLPYLGGRSEIVLPLAARLDPAPFTSGQQPRYVWDLAARVTDTNPSTASSSPLQVVQFVRPIDAGIKPRIIQGSRLSLSEVLLDPNLPNRDRRFPVSVDREGAPTFDGRTERGAAYGVPLVGEVSASGIPGSPRNQCVFESVYSTSTTLEVAKRLFGAPGQRFVDRRGIVFTVRSIDRNSIITVSPEFPVDNGGNVDFDLVNPVVFLPTASAVEPHVFTVNP